MERANGTVQAQLRAYYLGCRYESALVPFGEVVMAKIADADKMRAGKLDSAWVKSGLGRPCGQIE